MVGRGTGREAEEHSEQGAPGSLAARGAKTLYEEERDAAGAKLVQLLDRMEDALKRSGWLVGSAYSIADIAAVPFVKRIDEEIAPDEVTAKKHPRVTGWWNSIQARPAFERAKFGPFLETRPRH